MPFDFEEQRIHGVFLVKPRVFSDARGFFMETFKRDDFIRAGIMLDFVQDNHSRSTGGVLRGMHYQRGKAAQGKLIRCMRGEILDVGVDIRENSPTFGDWISANLNEENAHMLYLPPGFAHGFLVLSEVADILYKSTHVYVPEAEAGIRWNDPDISIKWDIKSPQLLQRDAALPFLKDAKM